MRGAGPLPLSWRNYIAMVVCYALSNPFSTNAVSRRLYYGSKPYMTCVQHNVHCWPSCNWENFLWPVSCGIKLQSVSRHKCGSLLRMQASEYLANGGDVSWLQGVHATPKKMQNLIPVLAILTHQPWLMRPAYIAVCLLSSSLWLLSSSMCLLSPVSPVFSCFSSSLVLLSRSLFILAHREFDLFRAWCK